MINLSKIRFCHTEHQIHRFAVSPTNANGLRLFRVPNVRDGNGALVEFAWAAVRQGDLLLALVLREHDAAPSTIVHLQFWHVLEIEHDILYVEAAMIVGSGGDGEHVYGRIAGLLGLSTVYLKCCIVDG